MFYATALIENKTSVVECTRLKNVTIYEFKYASCRCLNLKRILRICRLTYTFLKVTKNHIVFFPHLEIKLSKISHAVTQASS